MKSLRIAVLSLLLYGCLYGGENKDKFIQAAKDYIAKHSTPEAEAKWQKKWSERVETMIQDKNAGDEESALKRVVFDWCADNGEKWRQEIPIKDKLQMCRYYLICRSKGYAMPYQIEEQLTDENLEKFMNDKQ